MLAGRNTDMGAIFAYELTPVLTSLFKDSMMRKPVLGKTIAKGAISVHQIKRSTFLMEALFCIGFVGLKGSLTQKLLGST